jgi:hypothetical protein
MQPPALFGGNLWSPERSCSAVASSSLPTGRRLNDWPGLKALMCRHQPSYWQVAFEVILHAICAERLVLALVRNKPNAAPDDVLDVADPNIEADLEQLRNRMLINEFQRYQQLKGKWINIYIVTTGNARLNAGGMIDGTTKNQNETIGPNGSGHDDPGKPRRRIVARPGGRMARGAHSGGGRRLPAGAGS